MAQADRQRELLEHELRVVGLRLNERPPNVYFKKKSSGPVSISSTCALESISESDVRQLLHEYKINSAEAPLRRCESRSVQPIRIPGDVAGRCSSARTARSTSSST